MRGRHRGGRGRPFKPKIVSELPSVTFFKPRGVMLRDLEVEMLSVEELEAVRLVDYEDLEQEEAAQKMGISRKTLWRLLKSGRKRIIGSLIKGKAIEIKGGSYVIGARKFKCSGCGYEWEAPYGTPRPANCPECKSLDVYRVD